MTRTFDRRTVLRTGAAALAAGATGLAGCTAGSQQSSGGGTDTTEPSSTPTESGGDSGDGGGDSTPAFDGWLSNVGNFDGVTDRTDADEVTVTVGAQANGGAFGFAPPAVRVSSGTTVVWEWTGKGGSHNVVEKGGDYQSDLVATEGHTFSHTFEETGTSKYYCQPHKAMGMKGVVVVE